MAIYSIYRWTNQINGKVYIGQTKRSPKQRRAEHISSARRPKTPFHHALKKYGIDQFTYEVIFNCFSEEDLPFFEVAFIEEHNSHMMVPGGFGYNATKGGSNQNATAVSAAQRAKVDKGTHHFQSEEFSDLVIAQQNAKVANGSHPFQAQNLKLKTCPHCGKQGKGGGMYKNHFAKCKLKA